jgi:tRNA pseudouridine32 synthase/23S rRNA pseudouridine746 synthase
VEKRYVALVAGRMVAGERLIDLPLIADWPNRPRQMVDHAIGKPSRTRLRVAGYDAGLDATRVDLFPETGRSHQLRVHLQAIGHPSLGDELYAPPEVFARAPRLLLHAAFLAFVHPSTAIGLRVESGAPF